MIVLNKEDIEILVVFDELMDKIEEAYDVFYKNEYFMPPRPTVEYKNKTLLYMPCFTQNIFGTKILTVFPENRNIGEPAIDGLMLLNDYETGKPLVIMDGKTITSLRTGAVGGVGVRHLSKENASSVGIIGAGIQGYYQTLYACATRKIKNVLVYNAFNKDLTPFVNKLKNGLNDDSISISVNNSMEDFLSKSDIVITATTSNTPVLPNDASLLKGKCFIGIGSYKPSMREYPDAIFSLLEKVYVDLPFACEESGDLSVPIENSILDESKVKTFSDFLALKEKAEGDTTFFKSVGMGLFDLIISEAIYKKAIEKNIGQVLTL